MYVPDGARTPLIRKDELTIPGERILNHGGSRKGSITDGVYNHYEYDAEKRAALELWADALESIVGQGPAEIDGYPVRLSRVKGMDRIKVGSQLR